MKSPQMMKRGVADRNIDSGDVIGPSLFLVGALLAVGAAFYFALFDLSRPTVIANPGVDAYHAPPATRLVPLPRVSDAPEIAADPATPSDASLAQAPVSPDRAKDAQPSSHKRTRTARDSARDNSQYGSHDSGRRAFGYVPPSGNYPQWDAYRQASPRGSANNAWGSWGFAPPPRSRSSGGPKSPF